MATSAEETAYLESLRALDGQSETLKTSRASAGVLLSATSVVATLLGRGLQADMTPLWLRLIPVCFLVVSAGFSISILWPTNGLVGRFSAESFLKALPKGHSVPIDDVYRYLALYVDKHVKDNVPLIERLVLRLKLAALFVMLGMVSWFLVLVVSASFC